MRAPFDGVVIKKRAEVGETVSPFGVAGQSSREGGAIATIADLQRTRSADGSERDQRRQTGPRHARRRETAGLS